MIETRGWKRLEANRMFEFQQVSPKDFNAILRRSFVWRAVARFEDPRAVAGGYDDMWRDGVFPKDPDLKQFLISGPAILASLQIQNAFEMKFNKEDCERLIEDYAYWGGDRGLTEDTMREACGMPPRDRRNVCTQAASVIVVDNEPSEAEDPEVMWSRVTESIMMHLLTAKRLDITKPMFMRTKFKDVPNMNKEQLVASMLANKRLIQSQSRGKTEDVFIVGLVSKVKLDTLIAHRDRSSCPTLTERLAVSALEGYVNSIARSDNAEALAGVFTSLSTKNLRGRPTASAKNRKEMFGSKASKAVSHEKNCRSLVQKLKQPVGSSQLSPPKKRQRVKGREEPAVKEERDGTDGNQLVLFSTSYQYPDTTVLRTRKIARSLGAQKFTRRAQQHLLSHTHDLDIHNSVFTVLSQLLDKLQVVPAMPQDIRSAFDSCVSDRDKVCREELNVGREEGKRILTATLYGGSIPEHLAGNEFLIRLSKVSIYMRWLAISLLEDEFHRFRSTDVNKNNPDMSIVSHLYLATEDYILTAWSTFLETLKPTHLSLHFDGVRVSLPEGGPIAGLCKKCESYIQDKTGFRVTIREKQHRTVFQSIEQKSTKESQVLTSQCLLEKHGNCILAAIAAVTGKGALVREALAAEPHDVSCRSYRECEELCQVKLVAHLTFRELKEGNFLLHSEAGGVPHCVGLTLTSGSDQCVVHDIGCIYKLSKLALAEAVETGMDSSTCVYFQVLERDVDVKQFANDELGDDDASALLALEAAGRKRPRFCNGYAEDGARTRSSEVTPPIRRPMAKLRSEAASHALRPVASRQSETAAAILIQGSESEQADAEVSIPSHALGCQAESLAGSNSEMEGPASNACLDDDGVVIVDKKLLQSLADEVACVAAAAKYRKKSTSFECPCCPWRCFQSPGRVTDHLLKYHVERNQFCCSGKKQIKCVLSLHDSDMIRGHQKGKYLQRSARLLNAQVQPPLPQSINAVDKRIRLLLDSEGLIEKKTECL